MTKVAATTDAIIDKGFGDDREGRKIQGAIIHHVAGTDGLRYVANQNSRNSHPTYHVASNGQVTNIVHPDRQPFSTAHDVDNIAITFEIDNSSVGGDWPVSDAALQAVIEVLLDHETQSDREGFAKNIRGQEQEEFFIGWHSQYHATACPGPYILSRMDWLVSELNRRKAGTPIPEPVSPGTPVTKSISQLADEVLAGVHGNGVDRRISLGANYTAVQAEVNRRLSGKAPAKPEAPRPASKSISQLADEVLAGKHGNGEARQKSLGSNYSAVQAEVNRRLAKGGNRPAPRPNISQLADAVMRGEYGNGEERKRKLGSNYAAVQAEVNRRLS